MHSNSHRPCKVPNKIHAKVLRLALTPPLLGPRKIQHHPSLPAPSPAISPSDESYFHFGGDWNNPRPKRISLSTEIISSFLDSMILWRPNPTPYLARTIFLSPNLDKNHDFSCFLYVFPNSFPVFYTKNPWISTQSSLRQMTKSHVFHLSATMPPHFFRVFFRKMMIFRRKCRKIPPCPKHVSLQCESPEIYLAFKIALVSATRKYQNRSLWKKSEIFSVFFLAVKNKGSTFALAFGNERWFATGVH